MTNRQILPSDQPQAGNSNLVLPAAIAGVAIAALLSATVALLFVSGTSLAAWAGFSVGTLFGFAGTVAAILIAGPNH